MSFTPSYLELHKSGELQQRAKQLTSILEDCTLCPRNCHVNRNTELGYCQVGRNATVASYSPHFGEEDVLVGILGSGTIFFSYCNLGCVFCQNFSISQKGEGSSVNKYELAEIMINLQARGCHNINLVSPSHVIAQVVEALPIAIEKGLNVPLVYNTGGYDTLETIKLLDGIIDIYMPDIKYGSNEVAYELSCAKDYWDVVRAAVKEMHRQVGDIQLENNIATQGLLVRHLVLPGQLALSDTIFEFIAQDLSPETYLNIMDQYHPDFKSDTLKYLDRKLNIREYREAVAMAENYGLHRFA
jgi:putative pyruvate formate lyase activating enzyme